MKTEILRTKAFEWLEEVVTQCNIQDEGTLKTLFTCPLMTEENFDSLMKFGKEEDGKFLNDESVFRCDGWYFQLSEDFAYSQTETKSTDRYIIWAYCIDGNLPIADIAYWQWGSPFTGDNISEDVLEQCRKWIEKAKSQGYKPHDILKED